MDGAIGVFDSGVGGLTTVKELKKILPNENIIYLGDVKRVPYGTRSKNIILGYAKEHIKFFEKFNTKALVSSCGTLSSVAFKLFKSLGVFEIITPSVTEALNCSKNYKIGIIGTTLTIKIKKYMEIIKKINDDVVIYEKACPMFVYLIENGYLNEAPVEYFINEYLIDMKKNKIDTLILACTHFPIIKDKISNYFEYDINLIDSGALVAKHVKEFILKNSLENSKKNKGKINYYLTSITNFNEIAKIFLDEDIKKVSKINLE